MKLRNALDEAGVTQWSIKSCGTPGESDWHFVMRAPIEQMATVIKVCNSFDSALTPIYYQVAHPGETV